MTTELKVALVEAVWETHGLNHALAAVDLPKSTWYYHRIQKVSYEDKLSIIVRYGASGFRPRWATQREGARETPGGKTIGSLKLACLCGRHLLFDAM